MLAEVVIATVVIVSMPNPKLTPGVIDSEVSISSICTPGYTANIRNVSDATKAEIFKRYGLPRDGAKYEVDHFISLEIGGKNDVENLWPQPWPEARQKDVVETYLKRQVCAGKMTLRTAQRKIRRWQTIYKTIRK